jgi:hypothetical protein
MWSVLNLVGARLMMKLDHHRDDGRVLMYRDHVVDLDATFLVVMSDEPLSLGRGLFSSLFTAIIHDDRYLDIPYRETFAYNRPSHSFNSVSRSLISRSVAILSVVVRFSYP